MEDILASIRRILNEDEAPPGGATAAAEAPTHGAASQATAGAAVHPPAEGSVDDGVLVLDEAMLVGEPAIPPHAPPTFPLPVSIEPEPAIPLGTSPDSLGHEAPPVTAEPGAGLMAPESTAAAAASVGSLLRTLSQERSTQVYRGGPTIEDLVREEVRPLLKDWLDNHLPPLVERLVRQEIERVAGRAGI